MKPDETDRDPTRRKLDNWKSLAESLNSMLHYKTVELKEEFENQKKNLCVWLESAGDRLNGISGLSNDNQQKLRSSLENIRIQAALKAENEDALKEQQQKISDGIQQLQKYIADAYDASKEEIKNFTEEATDMTDGFHTRFDLIRLQLYLGKEEAMDTWEQKKKELSTELQAINAKLANGYENRAENWDHFSNEMSEAWGHIKQSFTLQTNTKP
jgi:CII-binding regulator of phage lambda lysogenization HflD